MEHTNQEWIISNGAPPPASPIEPDCAGALCPVDLSNLEALDGIQEPGDPDLVAELIGLFLDDTTQQLAQIEAAVQAEDALALRSAAHSLKGSSGSLGARQVAAWCQELEMIDDRANWTGVPILVTKLRTACAAACAFLAAERERRI